MTILTDTEINEIVDYIQGTCMSLDQAVHDITEGCIDGVDGAANWRELCDTVDRNHFLCVQCGWWSEVGDYAEVQENPSGDICSDCEPEEEDA